ncbi:MAG: 16S rRNA (guanine(966)-N(2))-methyltransferase RsmD [Blastocatellia bacterium]|nr:16S rRNA (guanine(966)-N(2))-methyltransferase RsmD [Blastocatellia bacterium]MCS7158308.1 16S rRNA (guanine(966)-N(2))-methyltransferase RsmD [Blastocatellia bacterium]MCX7753146.1 16S rRNA (guanine(966)-N(2))-methyltransferase RsmD [Blastocatellia bacterium]MDW8169461.1 16S rRNA (guanine(966)-N(2))-methyltransferase RsmD [Acidobacteriota bacterium]MDW8255735.1 16S rRNA (guanine(966)-N(2))-methyltransferase RsmD [Acidobacteriota bacterium]
MRVIAGLYKGRRLKSLSGREVRPTPDRLRESLFNILRPRLTGARFLDLCAGTGSVGIEALSRGARQVTFVERSPAVIAVLRRNLSACGIGDGIVVLQQDAVRALEQFGAHGETFDIIFFDPPYASMLYDPVLECLARKPWVLAPEGVLIVMHHAKRALEPRYGELERVRQVRQGENVLSFYTRRPLLTPARYSEAEEQEPTFSLVGSPVE